VTRFAPRISDRLLHAIPRLDDGKMPFAEVCRRVGEEADRLGLPRPSYQRVRVLVHEARRLRRQPTTADVLLHVSTRARAPGEMLDHVAGIGVRRLDP
jgi:hypothetical protein